MNRCASTIWRRAQCGPSGCEVRLPKVFADLRIEDQPCHRPLLVPAHTGNGEVFGQNLPAPNPFLGRNRQNRAKLFAHQDPGAGQLLCFRVSVPDDIRRTYSVGGA
jgi:hypothetical protein